jgi:superfamily II DNA or RNA helicase
LIVAARTRDLQDAGILCYARWFAPSELDTRSLVKGKVDLSLSENEARQTWGPLRGDDNIRTQIVGNILGHYERLHPERKHTLAFAPGVKESLWAAQFCRSRGLRALHVDGQDFWVDGQMYDRRQDEQKFQEARQQWRDGDIPILWNRFVFREALDEPHIRCIILATPIGSYRSFLQCVGRGLRTHPFKENCLVLDHGGAWWRFGSVNVNVDWESVFDCSDPDILAKTRIAHYREHGEPMGRVCPKCGEVHRAFSRLVVCQYCGHELKLGKPSRPILQADGTLTEVNGEPIKQWKIRATPDDARIWAGLYWNAVKRKGGEMTFNQLYQQAHYRSAVKQGTRTQPAFWKAYYPPRTLPLMPRQPNTWHRLVRDISRDKLY